MEDKDRSFTIDGLTSGLRGSSPQFDAMAKAAKQVAALEQELMKGPIPPPTRYNQRRREIDGEDMLRQTSDAYLQKKMAERGAAGLEDLRGKNDDEQARIDHALRIHSFCEAYQPAPVLTGKDVEKFSEADSQEFRSAAKVEEMQDLDEAYRLLAEFHKKHGMDTPEREKNLLKAGIDPHRHAPAPEEPGQEGPEEPGLGPA